MSSFRNDEVKERIDLAVESTMYKFANPENYEDIEEILQDVKSRLYEQFELLD